MISLYNLKIKSDYNIPGTFHIDECKPDIFIHEKKVPLKIDNCLKTPFYQLSKNEFLLNVPNISKYYVKDGKEIWVEPYIDSTQEEIVLFLLDSAFQILLQQRGFISLKGSCISRDDQSFMLIGTSNTGKSTLASKMIDNGYKLISDSYIITDGKSIFPGSHFISLWKDSILKLGYEINSLKKIRQNIEKYWIEHKDSYNNKILPINKLYLLIELNKNEIYLENIKGTHKLTELKKYINWKYLYERMDYNKRDFFLLTNMAQKTTMKKISFNFKIDNITEKLFQLIDGDI